MDRLTTLTSVFGQVQYCCSVSIQGAPVDRPVRYMEIMFFRKCSSTIKSVIINESCRFSYHWVCGVENIKKALTDGFRHDVVLVSTVPWSNATQCQEHR